MNTIKKLLIVMCAVLAGIGMTDAKPIKFGVKAGMNVNKLSFDKDLAKSSNSCGWTAGVMAEFTVPIIGIGCDAGLMYARMNNSSDVSYDNLIPSTAGSILGTSTDAATTEVGDIYGKNFLEIPINIKYKLSLPLVARIVKPYAFTGPNFAFRLGKNVKDNIRNIESRSCQIAWNVGLGVELFNHVQVGASYAFGINNVVKTINKVADTTVTPSDIKARNNYWTVTAAYVF
ncbi:MAG: PorT family protein [Muribaculaceae bacterium]|nr:PorT family protein [Muribaculaceae bacterium]